MASNNEEIKKAFELFDQNGNGKIDPKEIKLAMQSLGYDERNPLMYQIVAELDTPLNNKKGGVSFNDFCQTVNNRVPERETTEDLRKVYNLFLENPNDTTTTLASIKRVADELGEELSQDQAGRIVSRIAKNGKTVDFDEFYTVMTKKTKL